MALQNVFLLPLTSSPQTFQIVLGETTYFITNKWNDVDDSGWLLDIADENEVPIACNIPLVTGINLLDGLQYLGITGELYVKTSGNMPTAVPTLNNLGSDSNVYFVTDVSSG